MATNISEIIDGRPRTTGYNRRLAQWRVMWLIEHSTSHQHLWCIDSFVLKNLPLRQAPKRCAAYKKSQPHKQHIWFLPTRKPTLKNQKSCFLPTLDRMIEQKIERKLNAEKTNNTEF